MMMIYGLIPFMRQTLPYGELQHNVAYRWPTSGRIGKRASAQFLGIGDEKITLSGELRPELTGGAISMLAIKLLADEGRAWPLIGGNGMIYGMYVIENYVSTGSEFYSDGSARKITFSLSLLRVDESLISMFGDIKQQAGDLIDQAGALPGKITSAIDSVKTAADRVVSSVGGMIE